MTDSKYANLPGLAPDDEPDTYETEDVRPEADQHQTSDTANEETTWELAGDVSSETPLEKFHRLQLEINELSSELHELKDCEQPSDVGVATLMVDTSGLRQRLINADQQPLLQGQRGEHEALVSSVEAGVRYELSIPPRAADRVCRGGQGQGQGQSQEDPLVALERRLTKLETTVGRPTGHTQFRLGGDDVALLPAVSALSSKLQLLTAEQLKLVEQLLSKRFSQLHEHRLVADDVNKITQVEWLSEMVESMTGADNCIEEIAQALDDVSHIHDMSAGAAEQLQQLQQSQKLLDEQLAAAERQLQTTRDSCLPQLQLVVDKLVNLGQSAAGSC